MSSNPGEAEDLVGEISSLAEDPTSSNAEILAKLQLLAKGFTVEEVFAMISEFDTPDLLG